MAMALGLVGVAMALGLVVVELAAARAAVAAVVAGGGVKVKALGDVRLPRIASKSLRGAYEPCQP